MPRRATIQPRALEPDPVYSSRLVTQVINKVMNDGKKSTAEAIVYQALDRVGEQTGKPPLEVLEQAVKTVTPVLETRSRRVGGANYQVPVEVSRKRQQSLAFRWILEIARGGRRGRPFSVALAEEVVAAARREGGAFTKRENVHKMAEANKAFSHFAW